MTRFVEPTPEQLIAWREWVASRPEAVRVVAARFDPWTLYRLRTTNQRVLIQAFSEPNKTGKVTCRVAVTGEFNLVTHERSVRMTSKSATCRVPRSVSAHSICPSPCSRISGICTPMELHPL